MKYYIIFLNMRIHNYMYYLQTTQCMQQQKRTYYKLMLSSSFLYKEINFNDTLALVSTCGYLNCDKSPFLEREMVGKCGDP